MGYAKPFQIEDQKHKQQQKQKLDLVKIKKLCVSVGTFKKVKRQPVEWKKIFANRISYKELVYRIYKELSQLNKIK